MPGLAALLTPKYDRAIAQNIRVMTEAMHYESFYQKDIFNSTKCPLVASRVHLNIVNKEHQPIYNEDKTILIMMDGELHERVNLKKKLISAGHEIKTNSDAELVLHLYEDQGDLFANDLNGWFLAVIYDGRKGEIVIVNDCFGIYRAFYTQHENTFIIASEIKSILRSGLSPYGPNIDRFPEYFLYGSILNDQTLFKNIYRLPPASLWVYKDGRVKKKQYFDFSNLKIDKSINKIEFIEESTRLFSGIMPRYVSGESVSLSLTGGWDTRAVLALTKHLGYTIPCYTWCGPYRDSLDVTVARKAAKAVDLDYQVIYIKDDFFENFSDYANKTIYVSDGSADIFKSHEIHLNNLSRKVGQIRLTGKYGSQTMSGGFLVPKCNFCREMFSNQFIGDIGDFKQYTHMFGDWQSTIDAMRWLWPDGFMSIERSQVVLRSPYLDKEMALHLFRAPKVYLHGSVIQKHIIEKYCTQLALIASNKGAYIKSKDTIENFTMGLIAGVNGVLTRLDKAYLHQNVPHYFARLDPFMKTTGLEKIFLGSNNLACYRRWIKNELRIYMTNMLLDERTLSRPYINSDFMAKTLVPEHFNNKANYMREIGNIISLEIWHRLFVD